MEGVIRDAEGAGVVNLGLAEGDGREADGGVTGEDKTCDALGTNSCVALETIGDGNDDAEFAVRSWDMRAVTLLAGVVDLDDTVDDVRVAG